jgi:Hydroxymethylglutaryl-CoA reductase
MNGIDAVLLATMNDWRQGEANAHAFACRNGRYTSLTNYEKLPNGNVKGTIIIPISAGTVGGTSRSIPRSRISMKILDVSGSREFEEVLACVGLAQNFAAMRALSNEGIQKGHMALHSKNLAIAVGAKGEEIEKVSNTLIKSGRITMSEASKLLKTLREDEDNGQK